MLGVEGHDSPQRENVLQYMVAMSHHPAPAPPRPLSSGQTRPICSLSPRFAHRGPQLGTTCAPIRGPHRPLTFPTAIQFSANTAVLVGVRAPRSAPILPNFGPHAQLDLRPQLLLAAAARSRSRVRHGRRGTRARHGEDP